MRNIWSLIISFLFVFFILYLSTMLVRLFRTPKEESRKLVHIGVCNWWLLAMLGFDSWRWAIIGPIVFIFLNLISWYTGMFDSIERKTRDINNLGTVYYPISLLLLVLFTWYDSPVFTGVNPYIGGLGVMAMGYGDGFAALIGTWQGKHKYSVLGAPKSIEGSIAMFLASLVPLFLMIIAGAEMDWLSALGLAIAFSALGTIVEAVTPRGLDNLTVPLIVSFTWLWLIV